MTTPARNIHTYLNRPGYFYQKATCAGGFTLQTSTSNHWKEYLDVRPASVNNPMGASGWRNPSNWSHDHLEAIVSPIGEMLTQNWCANRAQFTGSRYIDGEYATDTGMSSFIQGPPAWVSNLATTRAYLALKNQQANLSEAFAEREQTKRLFSDGARGIAEQVRAFRKAHPREWGQVVRNGARNQLRGIPRRWLELQYGWKPLMSDIFGACDRLSDAFSDTRAYHARAKGAARWVERFNVPFASSPYFWTEHVERIHHVKVLLFYTLNNPALATFASLGLTNPLELGWELVRYSFVVDWFLPVGNWLSTLDADFGWRYETGVNSTFTRISVQSTPGHTPSTSSSTYSNFTVGPKAKGIRFRRTVLGTPPGVGLPHFKNPLSGVHVANAMALLVQAFH